MPDPLQAPRGAAPEVDTTTPLIEIVGATVYRGDNRVFDDLSLTLSQHESVAILGPNGAGKTTLLKLLMREIYPLWCEHPVVRILGKERGDIWELRRQLGIISSDLQEVYSPQVLGRQVVLSGFFSSVGVWGHQKLSEEQHSRVQAVLAKLDIEDLADRPFGELSSGQQRRLLLGRALVNEPAHLILDEPTSGLDLSATFQYLHTMRDLIRSGHTLVLVTHHIHEIPPEVTRVVMLNQGRVWADGPKSEVLTEARLSALYGVDVRLVAAAGWYQAMPA
ncbi:MAG: ATP-binding cassette domain-containing protein [Arenicellales bacterium]|nr:ATP-binding cassette domain-containing protein [Arenicellales bacterium]MDP6551108.1 ATP-binding cassette domain-containing protein [Arenicellales bacterium]MDP6790858.1 ATP-binding cassette domain-containing protein [Arenicellales bacterium]MDP6918769.1 ATP-binding cassette domain-containing protein [Arenicellales bacterium]